MLTEQRKSAPAAGTDGDAKRELHLHITTPPHLCQTLRGAAAWLAVIGMLGIVGGMERGSFPFLPGCFWLAALLMLLDWGSKPWQG